MGVAPSLLALDFTKAQQDLKRVQTATDFHYDVMDGHFVPNISFGPGILKQLKKDLPGTVTVHLMVTNPSVVYQYFLGLADKITIHVEVQDSPSILEEINAQVPVGLALNPETSVEAVFPFLAQVDHVLVMSVHPGFGGQSFIDSAYQKVAALNQFRKEHNLNFTIEVDGGVNSVNGKKLVALGADTLVMGSYLFNSDNPEEIIKIFA